MYTFIYIPSFKIPSLLKPGTGGKYFNPNNQLGMLANMVTPCPACSYQWELFAYDYQFCGPVFGCWRNLAYLMRYIEGQFVFPTSFPVLKVLK